MITTLQQQAEQSGLAFVDLDQNSDVPQWNVIDWPPLLGGWRQNHASVVLDHPEQNGNVQTVVVLGGYTQYSNSVLLLNLAEENKHWREGPPLNNNRAYPAAVVCSGGVYVIGGDNGNSNLDSVERIAVADLCSELLTSSTCNQWTTLSCRLSTKRSGCSAVAVYNRYIVIMGGYNGIFLSSVDIVDTAVPSNHTVIPGPSMTVPRCSCASAVIGRRIFVVGGRNETNLASVEYLELHDASGNETMNTANTVFPSSCRWTSHELELSVPRSDHAAVAVGSCLMVVGGYLTNEEVLDTRRNTVWTIPPSTSPEYVYGVVVHSRGVAVIGGSDCATLSLIDKNTQCFCRLMEQVPRSLFGSRTNSLGSAPNHPTVVKECDERPTK